MFSKSIIAAATETFGFSSNGIDAAFFSFRKGWIYKTINYGLFACDGIGIIGCRPDAGESFYTIGAMDSSDP